jgi:hypothetical protein
VSAIARALARSVTVGVAVVVAAGALHLAAFDLLCDDAHRATFLVARAGERALVCETRHCLAGNVHCHRDTLCVCDDATLDPAAVARRLGRIATCRVDDGERDCRRRCSEHMAR